MKIRIGIEGDRLAESTCLGVNAGGFGGRLRALALDGELVARGLPLARNGGRAHAKNKQNEKDNMSIWIIRDEAANKLEQIEAESPNAAFAASVIEHKASVTFDGETEGWSPEMGHGELYAAFRAAKFSHSEVARALRDLGYMHKPDDRAQKGGELNDKQAALVAKLLPMSQELRMSWARRMATYGALRDAYIHAEVKMDMAAERVNEWLENPKTDAQIAREEQSAWAAEEARDNNTVSSLDPNESVSLVYGRDGISDDCCDVMVQDLIDAGYGDLPFEGDERAATVWVSRAKFFEIQGQCA